MTWLCPMQEDPRNHTAERHSRALQRACAHRCDAAGASYPARDRERSKGWSHQSRYAGHCRQASGHDSSARVPLVCVQVSTYRSRADVIAAMLTSAHIPFWFDGKSQQTNAGRSCRPCRKPHEKLIRTTAFPLSRYLCIVLILVTCEGTMFTLYKNGLYLDGGLTLFMPPTPYAGCMRPEQRGMRSLSHVARSRLRTPMSCVWVPACAHFSAPDVCHPPRRAQDRRGTPRLLLPIAAASQVLSRHSHQVSRPHVWRAAMCGRDASSRGARCGCGAGAAGPVPGLSSQARPHRPCSSPPRGVPSDLQPR